MCNNILRSSDQILNLICGTTQAKIRFIKPPTKKREKHTTYPQGQ